MDKERFEVIYTYRYTCQPFEIAADSVKMKFTVFFLLIFFFASVSHTIHGSKNRVPLFIFGDSFLDAGNNNYINTTALDQANFWPYGETYFKFPTGRFSDGRLISDFIGKIRRSHVSCLVTSENPIWLNHHIFLSPITLILSH